MLPSIGSDSAVLPLPLPPIPGCRRCLPLRQQSDGAQDSVGNARSPGAQSAPC
jgi:hypothetical protein